MSDQLNSLKEDAAQFDRSYDINWGRRTGWFR